MDLLARREYAAAELRSRLLRRFPSEPETIEEQIARLAEEGLQSDVRMAESFIGSRIRRGQGPVKIKAELRGKGLDDQAIALAWEAIEVDWIEQISEVAEKKFGSEPPEDAREKARRQRFLQQRGFTFDQIRELF